MWDFVLRLRRQAQRRLVEEAPPDGHGSSRKQRSFNPTSLPVAGAAAAAGIRRGGGSYREAERAESPIDFNLGERHDNGHDDGHDDDADFGWEATMSTPAPPPPRRRSPRRMPKAQQLN